MFECKQTFLSEDEYTDDKGHYLTKGKKPDQHRLMDDWKHTHEKNKLSMAALETSVGQEIDRRSPTQRCQRPKGKLPARIRIWREFLHDYTRRKLRCASDRLPAIAGVAAEFQLRNPEITYVAGIWREDIRDYLLWVPRPPIDLPSYHYFAPWPPVSSHPNIPSWSWASYPGIVGYESEILSWHNTVPVGEAVDVQYAPRILSCSSERAGPDEFGDVCGGQLILEGKLHAIRLMEANFTSRRPDPKDWGVPIRDIDSGLKWEDRLLESPKCYSPFSDPRTMFEKTKSERENLRHISVRFDHDPLNLSEVDIHCLQIDEAMDRYDHVRVLGLALLQLPDGGFQRVGLFHSEWGYWQEHAVTKVITMV